MIIKDLLLKRHLEDIDHEIEAGVSMRKGYYVDTRLRIHIGFIYQTALIDRLKDDMEYTISYRLHSLE